MNATINSPIARFELNQGVMPQVHSIHTITFFSIASGWCYDFYMDLVTMDMNDMAILGFQ